METPYVNTVIYSASNTTYILVIYIKIENYGDMFRFTEPSSGQIQNTVLVQSVSAHTVRSHTVDIKGHV
jgi:hypothetical protein